MERLLDLVQALLYTRCFSIPSYSMTCFQKAGRVVCSWGDISRLTVMFTCDSALILIGTKFPARQASMEYQACIWRQT